MCTAERVTLSYVQTWLKWSNFDYNFTPVFTALPEIVTEVGQSTNFKHEAFCH